MKNKILLTTTLVFAVAALVGLTKLVLADSTGSILPIADGTYLQWTPSEPPTPPATTTRHYTMVDETSCNGDVDYNYTNTAGFRDSYYVDLSSIPDNATISAITITPCASANFLATSTPVSTSMAVFYRYDGTNSTDAVNYNLLNNTVVPAPLAPTAFGGLSLVKQSGSQLEVGAKLVSGTAGLRLSQIITAVSYTPTSTPTSTPPTVTTTAASQIKKFSATLNGQANSNGKATTGWFRYSTISPGTCNDTFGTKLPLAPVALGSGNAPVAYSTSATGLSSGTTYYYCAIASNADGTAFGIIRSFTTLLSTRF